MYVHLFIPLLNLTGVLCVQMQRMIIELHQLNLDRLQILNLLNGPCNNVLHTKRTYIHSQSSNIRHTS